MLISEDPEDFPNLFNIFKGVGPIAYSCKFTGVNSDPVAIQVLAKEVDFIFFKEAFGRSEEQVVFSKDLEEFSDDLTV